MMSGQAAAIPGFSNYDFQRRENWRWTPSAALQLQRPRQLADYEFSLADGIGDDFGPRPELEALLAQLPEAPLLRLNLAELAPALQIQVPEDFASDEVNILQLSAAAEHCQLGRIYVDVGARSRSAFWFQFTATPASTALPVVVLRLAPEAELEAVFWLDGAEASAQSVYVYVEQADGSRARLNVAQLGPGALKRFDLYHNAPGRAVEFKLGGVQWASGEELVDIHANVRHLNRDGTSEQQVRGVIDGRGFGQFDGMIYVAPGAQKTAAQQGGRYILLSDTAKSQSVPRLEIYADDVQCAHGSTAGYLDSEALFYLQSRGIDRPTAQKMLLLSFLHEGVVVEQEALHANLTDAINRSWLGTEGDDD